MRFSVLFSVLFSFCLIWSLAAAADNTECATEIVSTTTGPVCGGKHRLGKDIIESFLGIPYAASTAGPQRWTTPQARAPWDAPLKALAFGPKCPQSETQTKTAEDCLYLNVWRPKGDAPKDGWPVMVFIPGGDFYMGGASDPLFDGSQLATHDRIIVTINYRLGALGFLSVADLAGNYGFLDQQFALQWVQDNIQAFGGTPDRVTIFGQSSGAMSIGLHLASAPDSRDLFQAAIMESNLLGVPFPSAQHAMTRGELFMTMAGCDDVACLRKLKTRTLVELTDESRFILGTAFPGLLSVNARTPYIDGKVITHQPTEGARAGLIDKPFIIGNNSSESHFFSNMLPPKLDYASYTAWLYIMFGDDYQKILKAYPGHNKVNNLPTVLQVFTDYIFTCGAREFAEASGDKGQVYLFSELADFNVNSGMKICEEEVCHNAELPFVFGTPEAILKDGHPAHFTPSELGLSKDIQAYWASLGQTHGIDGHGLPVWPQFSDGKAYVVFDDKPAVTREPIAQCGFWSEIGYPVGRHYSGASMHNAYSPISQ